MEKTKIILKATQNTEEKLTEEANNLIQIVKKSIADGDVMYNEIRENLKLQSIQKSATRGFQDNANEMLEKSLGLLSNLSSKSKHLLKGVSDAADDSFVQEKR